MLAKGKFIKKNLSLESSRSVLTDLELSPNAKEILARAETSDEKPYIILWFKGKINAQTSSKTKIKEKIRMMFDYPVKLKNIYYIYKIFGASIELTKEDDGSITYDINRN